MTVNRFYDICDLGSARITALPWERVRALLPLLPCYRAGPEWGLRVVDPAAVRPLCTSVTRARVVRSRAVLLLMVQAGVEAFLPIQLDYGELVQLMVPPIVLFDGSQGAPVILDGMHRLFAAREAGMERVTVLAVEDVAYSLPGAPVAWSDVSVVEVSPALEMKFREFRAEAFRPVSGFLNGEWLWSQVSPRVSDCKRPPDGVRSPP